MARKSKQRKNEPAAAKRPEDVSLQTAPALRIQILVVVAALVLGVCVLYPELVFQGKVMHAGDTEAAASFASPIKQEMEKGHGYPLWNPYLFSGMPSYESLSYTPNVYPMNALVWVLVRILKFPRTTWLLFHILMLGAGVAVLLMERRVHYIIAAGAGIVMMWMPNHVAVGAHGHGSQAVAVAYIPFALLVWDRLWRGRDVLLGTTLLAFIIGFQLLRAHLQISFYTMAILGLHALFFGVLQLRDAWRGVDNDAHAALVKRAGASAKSLAFANVGAAIMLLAVVVVLAIAMSAVLFLPVQDYAQYSIRGASGEGGLDYDYATSWSLHPTEMMTFIVPFSYGFGKHFYFGRMPFTDYPNYVGIGVVFFAVIAVVLRRTRFVGFLVFLIAVSTLVAFGKHVPVLYGPLFKLVPFFNKFRVPVMVLIVQQLSFVLLFGIGLDALLRQHRPAWSKRVTIATVVGAVAFIIALVTADYWTGAFAQSIAPRIRNVRSASEQITVARLAGELLHKDLIKQSLIFTLTLVPVALVFRGRMKAVVAAIIVLIITMVDLYLVDQHIIRPEKLFRAEAYRIIKEKQDGEMFLQRDGVVEFLSSREGRFRVFPVYHPQAPMAGGDFQSNRYMNFEIASVGGYHPAKLSLYQTFIEALTTALESGNYNIVDMLNARYMVSSNPFPENPVFVPVWEGQDFRGQPKYIYENKRALPRVYFVDNYDVADDTEVLDLLVAGTTDMSRSAFLDREPIPKPQSAAGASAEIVEYRFNEIKISVDLPANAVMVLSEVFYPKWHATIDGQPADMLRANTILRAVALPAGAHDVVFRYDNSVLKRALIITILATALSLIGLLIALGFKLRGRVWKLSS
jgi:hypothetical protein